jgi:hypothetical protein
MLLKRTSQASKALLAEEARLLSLKTTKENPVNVGIPSSVAASYDLVVINSLSESA